MYTEIDAFRAKAKLSELLQRVKRGQHYTITLRGRPIADLIPSANTATSASQSSPTAAIESMRHIHKIHGVSAEMITEWLRRPKLIK